MGSGGRVVQSDVVPVGRERPRKRRLAHKQLAGSGGPNRRAARRVERRRLVDPDFVGVVRAR